MSDIWHPRCKECDWLLAEEWVGYPILICNNPDCSEHPAVRAERRRKETEARST